MSSERRLGEVVDFEGCCSFPKHEAVSGKLVKLVPLSIDHGDDLFQTIGGERNNSLYDYLPYGPYSDNDIAPFRDQVKVFAESQDPQFYAIIDLENSQPVGWSSYLRIDEKNRVIEIGHVLYSQALQRTKAATEIQYLLANRAFEQGFRRLEWKTNALNIASQRAALRLGYTHEGVFRQHQIVKGRNRDSAWFSILDKEWPNRKKALEMWLDASNFVENGTQKKDLSTIRREIEISIQNDTAKAI